MGFKCERVSQITLLMENRPGILADLCAHLGDRGIDIRAITTRENADRGHVRLVVDDPEVATRIFAEAGLEVTTKDCLALEMPNLPRSFARAAQILAVAGINIDYIYGSTTPGAPTALGIFGLSDLDRALTLNWENGGV